MHRCFSSVQGFEFRGAHDSGWMWTTGYSVLFDRVDSEPELWVDHTILDSVEGVVDHRRMPDTDFDATESVQFLDEVFSDVEAFSRAN